MNFRSFKEKVKKYPLFGSDLLDMLSSSPQSLRNQINRWKKMGLITNLKRGLYALALAERSTGLSKYFLANNLSSPSYLSLESALSYYKLIPERVISVTSVTPRKTKTFKNEFGVFAYKKLKTDLIFGFHEETDEFGFKFMIADPEKALLDYLYLNLGAIKENSKDYFKVSLRLQNRRRLDKNKIRKYASHFGIRKLNRLVESL